MKFSRILLKLSGEALGAPGDPFDHRRLAGLAQAVARVVHAGVQVGIVVGAGNLFRARSANLQVVNRVTADNVGMLATVMNGAVVRDYLRAEGCKAALLSPGGQPPLAAAFARDRALHLMQQGTVLVFAGGTGNPYFTTDSAAALRALEIGADALLKGTQVDGVYAADPRTDPKAERFDRLDYDTVIARRLRVMDLTAFTLCAENDLPLFVFDISDPENLVRAATGDQRGTWITKETE